MNTIRFSLPLNVFFFFLYWNGPYFRQVCRAYAVNGSNIITTQQTTIHGMAPKNIGNQKVKIKEKEESVECLEQMENWRNYYINEPNKTDTRTHRKDIFYLYTEQMVSIL